MQVGGANNHRIRNTQQEWERHNILKYDQQQQACVRVYLQQFTKYVTVIER